MAFDVSNFVIDRILRGIMTRTDDGSYMFSCHQLRDPTISISAETTDVMDAIGSRIAQFDRGKSATLTATNALFDLNLAAAQFGSSKNVASATNRVLSPLFEDISAPSTMTSITLKQVPAGPTGNEIPYIYELRDDDTIGTKYTRGATATATTFVLNAATKTITLPTGRTGRRIFVMYEYMAEAAVEIFNTAKDFPVPGRFIMEVLGMDVCNPTVKYHAYIIFPNYFVAIYTILSTNQIVPLHRDMY